MITKSVVLPCSVDRAFELFSARIDEWWPPERRHLTGGTSVVTLEADRFFERDASGVELVLGAVRVWEPPHRIALDWYPGTDEAHPTEVEVLFVARGAGTDVRIIHRAGPHSVNLFPARAPRYGASWDLVAAALCRAAGVDDR